MTPPDVDSELARVAAFRTALRLFLRRTETVAAQADLTPQRYDLLLMIRTNAPVQISELYELLHMKQTAVAELVYRAEEAGLIERRQSTEDGRVWFLELTPEGERRLMQAFSALRNDRDALASAFQDVERRFREA